LCPFASAKPTDMAVASNAIAKVFSIISSSLDYAVKLYMNNNAGAKALDRGFSQNRLQGVLLRSSSVCLIAD